MQNKSGHKTPCKATESQVWGVELDLVYAGQNTYFTVIAQHLRELHEKQ